MHRTSKEAYLPVKMFSLAMSLIVLSHHGAAKAADWPQWRGPNRDAVCQETDSLGEWYFEAVIEHVSAPTPGILGTTTYTFRSVEQVRPTLMWTIHGLGAGYSSVSIADGKLYTMGDREKTQFVYAYDLATQKELWAAKVGKPHDDGPRCTPTVDNGLIYALGTSGDVVCIDAGSGSVRWRKNFQGDLGVGKNPGWKYSESPLVDGDRLICTPGGRDAVMVALDKKTGQVVWKCSMPDIGPRGKDEAGYSSIVVSEGGGVRQYVQLTNKGVIGVAAKDGRFLWGYNRVANSVANISTPVVYEDYVFCSTAYNTGSALLKLIAADGGVRADEVYFLDAGTFQNHHGGFVKIGDYLYGGHGHNMGKPTCIEFMTGRICWQAEMPKGTAGSAAVLYADGNLYFRYENDVVALVQATPEKYNLKGLLGVDLREYISGWKEGARVRLNIALDVASVAGLFNIVLSPAPVAKGGRPAWAHPVISDGKLYLRHADDLFCYDVKSQ